MNEMNTKFAGAAAIFNSDNFRPINNLFNNHFEKLNELSSTLNSLSNSSIILKNLSEKATKIFNDLNLLTKPININKIFFNKTINFDRNYSEIIDDININTVNEAIESSEKTINNINITINNNVDSSDNNFSKKFLNNLITSLLVTLILNIMMIAIPFDSNNIPSINDLMNNLTSSISQNTTNKTYETIAECNYTVYSSCNSLNEIATLKKIQITKFYIK